MQTFKNFIMFINIIISEIKPKESYEDVKKMIGFSENNNKEKHYDTYIISELQSKELYENVDIKFSSDNIKLKNNFTIFDNIKNRINSHLEDNRISDLELSYKTRKNFDELIKIISELESRGYNTFIYNGRLNNNHSNINSNTLLKIKKLKVTEL